MRLPGYVEVPSELIKKTPVSHDELLSQLTQTDDDVIVPVRRYIRIADIVSYSEWCDDTGTTNRTMVYTRDGDNVEVMLPVPIFVANVEIAMRHDNKGIRVL